MVFRVQSIRHAARFISPLGERSDRCVPHGQERRAIRGVLLSENLRRRDVIARRPTGSAATLAKQEFFPDRALALDDSRDQRRAVVYRDPVSLERSFRLVLSRNLLLSRGWRWSILHDVCDGRRVLQYF